MRQVRTQLSISVITETVVCSDSVVRFAFHESCPRKARCNTPTLEKVALVDGNVGYVKVNMFADPALCGHTAIAAMHFLANVGAMVFDLRDNGGGGPAHGRADLDILFDQPTHLNDIWNRKTGATERYWTLPVVPGKRLAAALTTAQKLAIEALAKRKSAAMLGLG